MNTQQQTNNIAEYLITALISKVDIGNIVLEVSNKNVLVSGVTHGRGNESKIALVMIPNPRDIYQLINVTVQTSGGKGISNVVKVVDHRDIDLLVSQIAQIIKNKPTEKCEFVQKLVSLLSDKNPLSIKTNLRMTIVQYIQDGRPVELKCLANDTYSEFKLENTKGIHSRDKVLSLIGK